MEHIRQYDWCSSTPDIFFVDECDLDNCVTEKILRNKFYDPLISSDSESEAPNKIDWDEVFKESQEIASKVNRIFVPGLRPVPPYPKLSSLTAQQHVQCLKVLCAENPHILQTEFLPRPTKQDHRVFEEVKEKYAQEQKEYIEWAKSLWTSEQCVRALRPKPAVEMVYEAEFRVRAQRLQAFPKHFEMAAQIPLEAQGNRCEMVHKEDLISVSAGALPQIEPPDRLGSKLSVVRPCAAPEPCHMHPCRFVLPNECAVSILPITEINRELAQYALENGARCIASENALKCLVELNRHWAIPVSVCEAISPEGEKLNVSVLSSECIARREGARARTRRAYRHLLELALVPATEKIKIRDRGKSVIKKSDNLANNKTASDNPSINDTASDTPVINYTASATPAIINNVSDTPANGMEADADSSDDDENNLFIDTECDTEMNEKQSEETHKETERHTEAYTEDRNEEVLKNGEDKLMDRVKSNDNSAEDKVASNVDEIGVYSCTCTDALSALPPPRSFRKWQVLNKNTRENYDIIVHCPHKVRGKSGEVLLEPITEYQSDLGGSEQPKEKIKSVALSLLLRPNASVLNVRVDGPTGDVITCSQQSGPDLIREHAELTAQAVNAIHTALNQLQGLLPGNYILQHEPGHGANALLYAARAGAGAGAGSGRALSLQFDGAAPADTDEAAAVKAPPTISTVLLPYHKYRKILPCAFTPHASQLARESRRAPHKQKQPPQAIRWPKKKKKNNSAGN